MAREGDGGKYGYFLRIVPVKYMKYVCISKSLKT